MKKLSAEAVAVLSSGVEVTGSELRIAQQLDRKLYVEVNAAIEALGGKWNRKRAAHVFPSDPRVALRQVVGDGAFVDAKRDFEQFFTPAELAREIVRFARVEPGHEVLEPSAGRGLLLQALGELACASTLRVVAVEIFRDFCPLMPLAPFAAGDCICADFLTLTRERLGSYDRVVMNPPFGKDGGVAHVLHAFSMLKPGGRMVAVMSAGVGFYEDRRTRAFRKLVESRGSMEPLPPLSFRSSGTDVNTALVTLEAP